MPIYDLTPDDMKALVDNPDDFIKSDYLKQKLTGLDLADRSSIENVIKAKYNLDDENLRQKLDEVAMVRLKEVDVFN